MHLVATSIATTLGMGVLSLGIAEHDQPREIKVERNMTFDVPAGISLSRVFGQLGEVEVDVQVDAHAGHGGNDGDVHGEGVIRAIMIGRDGERYETVRHFDATNAIGHLQQHVDIDLNTLIDRLGGADDAEIDAILGALSGTVFMGTPPGGPQHTGGHFFKTHDGHGHHHWNEGHGHGHDHDDHGHHGDKDGHWDVHEGHGGEMDHHIHELKMELEHAHVRLQEAHEELERMHHAMEEMHEYFEHGEHDGHHDDGAEHFKAAATSFVEQLAYAREVGAHLAEDMGVAMLSIWYASESMDDHQCLELMVSLVNDQSLERNVRRAAAFVAIDKANALGNHDLANRILGTIIRRAGMTPEARNAMEDQHAAAAKQAGAGKKARNKNRAKKGDD